MSLTIATLTRSLPRVGASSICSRCAFRLEVGVQHVGSPDSRLPLARAPRRTFFAGARLLKKGGKQESKRTVEVATEKSEAIDHDPADFAALSKDIEAAHARLKTQLQQLRSGGRFNHEIIESLRVALGKGSATETVKLGDIAQVVPRGGRTVIVLVGEMDVSAHTYHILVSS